MAGSVAAVRAVPEMLTVAASGLPETASVTRPVSVDLTLAVAGEQRDRLSLHLGERDRARGRTERLASGGPPRAAEATGWSAAEAAGPWT